MATRAGVSTALVHHYFSTREELLDQALLHSFELAADERFGDEADAAPKSATQALAAGDPHLACRSWASPSASGCCGSSCGCGRRATPSCSRWRRSLYERYRAWLGAVIEAGVEAGEFTADDPERVADHAIALLDGLGLRALLRDPEMDLERAQRTIAELLAPELGLNPGSLFPARAR